MTAHGNARRRHLLLIGSLIFMVTACPVGAPGSAPAPAATLSQPVDAFADLTYRLDLPVDWIVLGSPAYDATLDGVSDVASWLKQLDLVGSNAFRAVVPTWWRLAGWIHTCRSRAISPRTTAAASPGLVAGLPLTSRDDPRPE